MQYNLKKEYLQKLTSLMAIAENSLEPKTLKKPDEISFEYARILLCFYGQQLGSVSSIIDLYTNRPDHFQATNALFIVRAMLEVLITSKYISLDKDTRVNCYAKYSSISQYRWLQKFRQHRETQKISWHKTIKYSLENTDCDEIEHRYKKAIKFFKQVYELKNDSDLRTWSNKSIYDMAKNVGYDLEYDIIYKELSRYTHCEIEIVGSYLRGKFPNYEWTMETDILVARKALVYSALIFFEFLKFYAYEFNIEIEDTLKSIIDWKS